jgi:iron complex transport system substrate-binding protein
VASLPRMLLFISACALVAACAPTAESGAQASADGCVEDFDEGTDYFPDKVEFTEASAVSVSYEGHYKVVEVAPPDTEPVHYVLVQCGTPAPDTDDLVVEVPVSEVVTLTTTNLPHFDELGATDRLVGVGVGAFVTTESVAARIEAGELPDYADQAGQPDLERLVERAPELLIIDGVGDAVLDEAQRIVDAGVPTVVNADFNEHTLLGRAEWLKFTALFLGAEAEANDAYTAIAERYDEIATRVVGAAERPKVFANTPWEGTWFMPGGASFFANAVEDAGGEYAFGDDESAYSLQLDIETVLDRAGDADVWLQAGSVRGSLDDLLDVDERFAEFRAFADGEVWAYDRWINEAGGHAVFEVAYTRADLFLADLATILHPDLMGDHELVFFGSVGELVP